MPPGPKTPEAVSVSQRRNTGVGKLVLGLVDDMPNCRTLMDLGNKAPALCLWCFDLLHLDGVRLMPMPLEQRQAYRYRGE